MQAFYRGAWVQGQYRPVRFGVSCAAVRCGVHVLSTHRDMVADLAFRLYLNRDAGILSGAWVQGQYLASVCELYGPCSGTVMLDPRGPTQR